jgi:hypothetical protein
MYQTQITWYNRKEKMPEVGKRILVLSPMYKENDPFRIRLIDSQFYHLSTDAEWWADVPIPQ